ncbi:MAG: hypothetical protein ACTS22_02700 [Phycisphaerales bacterium]
MRLLVILLIGLGLMASPLRAAAAMGCGCPDGAASIEDDGGDGCCLGQTGSHDDPVDPSDRDRDEAPCDCPLPCCGIVKVLAAAPTQTREAPIPIVERRATVGEHRVARAAHLDRLKRPPRQLTRDL